MVQRLAPVLLVVALVSGGVTSPFAHIHPPDRHGHGRSPNAIHDHTSTRRSPGAHWHVAGEAAVRTDAGQLTRTDHRHVSVALTVVAVERPSTTTDVAPTLVEDRQAARLDPPGRPLDAPPGRLPDPPPRLGPSRTRPSRLASLSRSVCRRPFVCTKPSVDGMSVEGGCLLGDEHMCRWRRTILASWLWVLAVPGASAQVLTEAQALDRMRSEHPQVRLLALRVRELEANSRERGLLTNPTFSYTREDAGLGTDDFFLVTQELPVRGRLGLLGEAAGQAVTVAEARADADLLTFETGLRLAFADLLHSQERVVTLEDGLAALDRLIDVLRIREREGEGSSFDRLRAEREVADVAIDLAAVRIDRLKSQARLASFFAPGSDPTELHAAGRLANSPAAPALDQLVAQALSHRSDYRALGLEQARWDTERRAAERLRLPGASLTAGLKRSDVANMTDSGYAVTATVAIPLFNRGQAQIARAEAARLRADAEHLVLGARIESEVRAAHAAASRYGALLDRYRTESVERAVELVSIATTAYEEGEYGILELLDAHRVRLAAELRLLELSADATPRFD